MNSWDLLYKTVSELSASQGFYSRLKHSIDTMDKEDLELAKERINKTCKFAKPIDVILFLEQ